MKITKIEYSMTRQITNFHPASYTISADLAEGDDVEKCCKELQEMTIRVLYKDSVVMRDSLIKQLCGSNTEVKFEIKSKNQQNANGQTNEENDFPNFQP